VVDLEVQNVEGIPIMTLFSSKNAIAVTFSECVCTIFTSSSPNVLEIAISGPLAMSRLEQKSDISTRRRGDRSTDFVFFEHFDENNLMTSEMFEPTSKRSFNIFLTVSVFMTVSFFLIRRH